MDTDDIRMGTLLSTNLTQKYFFLKGYFRSPGNVEQGKNRRKRLHLLLFRLYLETIKRRLSAMSKVVLVTGGAGYIGSHTSYLLQQRGYRVIIIDNFVYEQPCLLPSVEVIRGDFSDSTLLDRVFSQNNIDVVMHFAAYIEVGESVIHPQKFYENNVSKTIVLLGKMVEYGVTHIIFSSSCAVYGEPRYVPIDEKHPYGPASPYGKTKLALEFVLQDYATAYGMKYISLRYFNAAGALGLHDLGEWHNPETHVIPNLMRAALHDKEFFIFGNDYPTSDGTCLRDYVHVLDIADAHVRAYEYLQEHTESQVFNLGSGSGYTVKQLIEVAEKVCKKKINVLMKPRRGGDVEALVADTTKVARMLGWQPQHSDLERMLEAAYAWEKRRAS